MDSRSYKSKRQYLQMTNNNNNRRNNKSNPVSYNVRMAPTVPLAQQRVYSGRDLIVPSYSGMATFNSDYYSINPRLADKFPSASLQAQRYDMYQFDELVFRWVPTSAVTTSPGVIFLAWEPNANRDAPSDDSTGLQAMNAYEHHSQGPVYSPNLVLRISKNKLGGPRYCRSGPTMSDLNLYDTGRFLVASDKCDATGEGYFEVDYRIRFFNYHLEEGDPIQNRAASVRLITSAITCPTGVETQIAFNSLVEDFGGDDTTALSSGDVLLPKGKYLIMGTVDVRDDTNELFQGLIRIRKNGAALSTDHISYDKWAATTGPHFHTVHVHGIVSSSGTDTIGLSATLTGAAGTLTVQKDSTRMTILALS